MLALRPFLCWEFSVHILVEKFSVFRLEIQYWMLLAAVIVAAAITIGMRK
jgi:hypothetical protein